MNINTTDKASSTKAGGELHFSRGKTVLFATIICVGFFILIEIVARVGAFFVYDRSPFFLFYGFYSSMANQTHGHSVSRDGYAKFPASQTLNQYGAFTKPTPIRINSAGLRGADFEVEKPAQTFRVVSLGGSSTFGYYNRDDYTYPAILQRKLAMHPAFASARPEVINAGIPHARSKNLLAMLNGEVLGYAPEVITVYTGYNDAMHTMDANFAQRLSNWLHAHFASYVALKAVISALGGPELHSRWAQHDEGVPPQYIRRQIELNRGNYLANIRAIVERAREEGVKVVLIKQPVNLIKRDGPKASLGYVKLAEDIRRRLDAGESVSAAETGHAVHASLMDALDQFSELSGVYLIDFIALADANPDFLASTVHLTENANDVLASLLVDSLAAIADRR